MRVILVIGISIVVLALLCLLPGCKVQNNVSHASQELTTSAEATSSLEATVDKQPKPVLVDDSAKKLDVHQESEGRIRSLMKKIASGAAYNISGHEVYLEDVRRYVTVSELRPISLEGSYSGLVFYSAHDNASGGRLFVFYNQSRERSGMCSTSVCMFVGKALHFNDFDNLNIGSSTIEDVERIDPATTINFFNGNAKNPNWYVKLLNCFSFLPEYTEYSGHITKDGIVTIAYRKAGEKFIVAGIDRSQNDIVTAINANDWPD